jgi:hypothetical protein
MQKKYKVFFGKNPTLRENKMINRMPFESSNLDLSVGTITQGRCPCTPPETLLKKGFWTS